MKWWCDLLSILVMMSLVQQEVHADEQTFKCDGDSITDADATVTLTGCDADKAVCKKFTSGDATYVQAGCADALACYKVEDNKVVKKDEDSFCAGGGNGTDSNGNNTASADTGKKDDKKASKDVKKPIALPPKKSARGKKSAGVVNDVLPGLFSFVILIVIITSGVFPDL